LNCVAAPPIWVEPLFSIIPNQSKADCTILHFPMCLLVYASHVPPRKDKHMLLMLSKGPIVNALETKDIGIADLVVK
jgi:hypothetical protein